MKKGNLTVTNITIMGRMDHMEYPKAWFKTGIQMLVKYKVGICKTLETPLNCHLTDEEYRSKIKVKVRWEDKMASKRWEGELGLQELLLATIWIF
jgi:hypothetical protein